ncbi:RNA-binding protein 7 [Amia ocellicauda]|uniref:RNA-binding protein 7 n=1 Tax=Amia ocellicauda TaxID=2972642 RepID=UPI003464DD80
MGISEEADRTLFVGNLDPRVTEEILFELFLQAGPMIKVKIPKDKDGKAKQFAFVNFKHEVSVPYGMSLLNGTRLFGRPLKIQFRSGSSHGNTDANSPAQSPVPSPSGAPSAHAGRFDRAADLMSPLIGSPPALMQRSLSSPESLQRQVMMNNVWQMQQLNGAALTSGFQQQSSPHYRQGSPGYGGGWQQEAPPQRGQRHHQDAGHYSREHRGPERGVDPGSERHFRAQRDGYYHQDERGGGRSSRDNIDRRRDSSRDGRWRPHKY